MLLRNVIYCRTVADNGHSKKHKNAVHVRVSVTRETNGFAVLEKTTKGVKMLEFFAGHEEGTKESALEYAVDFVRSRKVVKRLSDADKKNEDADIWDLSEI